MAMPAGREGPIMELRVCVHISGRKAYLCTIRILHESLTFAGHDGTQHKREPSLFRGPSTEKRLPIRKKVITNKRPKEGSEGSEYPGSLRQPSRGGHNWSLATAVNAQLREEADLPPQSAGPRPGSRRRQVSPEESLAACVSAKLEEGDFKGAVRLASSDDTLAPINEATFEALLERHPLPPPDSIIPSMEEVMQGRGSTMIVTEGEILQAIRSFPRGSVGGPDGLRPQHLKDMISDNSFVQLLLDGRTPTSVRPFFFGANLTALQKKQGGVRPIAVGCTLRRLSAKVAGAKVAEEMGELLAPQQLGYGVKKGVEAAVHATRLYLRTLGPRKAILKLDFRNAFNSIRRDKVL